MENLEKNKNKEGESKMKKIIPILLMFCLTLSFACARDTASDPVKEYLGKYNNHNPQVLTELNDLVKEEGLSEEQGNTYESIMKKQYKDLKYEIVEEKYDGDEAIVTVQISVYDLYKAQKEAEEYKNNHKEEFLSEDKSYDADKFLEYKLEQMKASDTRVDYTIEFNVIKKEGKWTLEKITTEDLEKIHGIYNYQNN